MTVKNEYMYWEGGEGVSNGQWAGRAHTHKVRQGRAGQAEKGENANSRDPWL